MKNMQDMLCKDEKQLAERIMKHICREAVKEYRYLEKPIYYLTLQASEKVNCLGANYRTLYYNPTDVIEQFDKSSENLITSLVHAVLHCMLLHPSIGTAENERFNHAADIAVNAMLENKTCDFGFFQNSMRCRELMNSYDCDSAVKLYNKALTDKMLDKQLKYISLNLLPDDHSVWYITDDTEQENDQRSSDSKAQSSANDSSELSSASQSADDEAAWKQMLAAAQSYCSRSYGTGSGNIFAPIKPPDRFSRFSYAEYIRRFAKEELTEEDPETIDMTLYTTSMEMYGDIPIVEWNEVRECCNPSDIIIAIDMSGSCEGDIAASFLRQIYTLFDEMNIRKNVNIHTVFFDTQILYATVIRNKYDADKFISEYTPQGFGGTDFNCVFDFADDFPKRSKGRKLKGLFFFSDAYGCFPDKRRTYPTTFFVPESCGCFSADWVPEWVELVHYAD